jgi:HPt (histidine-containing phosphotransfer) domain-containing protein
MTNKKDRPSVATFADHEVITPPNKLRKAITKVRPGDGYEDPIARAEQALAQLSSEFAGWMQSECERLDAARRDARAKGLKTRTRDALFRAAHDIKGQAATFGYPWLAESAESLCRLIEHTPDMTRIPFALIDQHVEAIRAIVRESARPDVAQVASALTSKLRQVTDDFLSEENHDRPDLLEGILAPPLSAGETTP